MTTQRFSKVRTRAAMLAAGLSVVAAVAMIQITLDQSGNSADVQPIGAAPATVEPPASGELPESSQDGSATKPSLERGGVEAAEGLEGSQSAISLIDQQSSDGAVAAFTKYVTWLVSSPAAAQEPALAVDSVASDNMTAIDREVLLNNIRDDTPTVFDSAAGAYRVLGHSGDQAQPDMVMVEVMAPMTVEGVVEWRVLGGTVSWQEDGWRLNGVMPREINQPSQKLEADKMSAEQKGSQLEGLGWLEFSNAD